MEILISFLGRFHPMLVHFPVGILVLAFVFEVLAVARRFKKLKASVQPMLVAGALSAVVSAITGYFLSLEGGYPDSLLLQHQAMGIATALLSVAWCWARPRIYRAHAGMRTRARVGISLALFVLLSFAGHWGGSLTHGEDYFFNPFRPAPPDDGVVKFKPMPDPGQAALYTDVVQPILEAKCYSCHSSKKQKGQLRLDGVEQIMRGAKHGPVLSPGIPDSSALYHRLVLPVEDEHHMPPGEKPQLTSSEIDLIQWWVADGFDFEKKVHAYENSARMKAVITAMVAAARPRESWIPETPVAAADQKAVDSLRGKGVLVMPVSREQHYLSVNLVNVKALTDTIASLLVPLKDQIVWLNLADVALTDTTLRRIGELTQLRYLYAQNTPLTDAGLTHLSRLSRLRLLNLVGTRVTDKGLPALAKLTALEELYLYNTAVTPAGYRQVQAALGKLRIDTGGYALPALATDTMVYKRNF